MYRFEYLPTRQEEALVERLRALALAERWQEWNFVRAIYADYLEEIDDPRLAITRADWIHVRHRPATDRVDRLDSFEVRRPIEAPGEQLCARARELIMGGAINAWPILHFDPGTLRIVRALGESPRVWKTPFVGLRLTWANRRMTTSNYDTGYMRGGLPALFLPTIPEI